MDSKDDFVAAIENNELVAPDFRTFGPFAMTEKGLTKNITYRNKVIPGVKVSARFDVVSYCRNPDGEGWGKLIRFHDADGRLHTRHVSDVALHGDPSKLAGEIGSAGLYINRTRQKEFAEYLNGVVPTDRITLVNRTGWHDLDGKLVFVMPDETIGDAPGETVMFDGSGSSLYKAMGSLDGWKAGVGALASASGGLTGGQRILLARLSGAGPAGGPWRPPARRRGDSQSRERAQGGRYRRLQPLNLCGGETRRVGTVGRTRGNHH
jgi:hypothetical protein